MSERFTGDDIQAAVTATPAAEAPSPSAPSTPTGSEPSAATTAPSPESGEEPVESAGPIPFDRHKAILEKTRREYDEKYGWVGERTKDDIEQMEQWYRWADTDPIGFRNWFENVLRQDPTYAAQLERAASGQGQAPPFPVDPDLQTPDGQPAFSLKALQGIRDAIARDVEGRVNARLSPIEQRMSQSDLMARAEREVSQELAEAQTWEGFSELVPVIKGLMEKDKRLSIATAYARAFKTDYLPKLRQRIRESTLGELNKKAHAATENPDQSGVAQKADRDKSFVELLQERMSTK